MTLMRDNRPQFSSKESQSFSSTYYFDHITSSPHFLQSNELAEQIVCTVKKLLQGSKNPFLALSSYCMAPLPWCNLPLAELLMGRQLKSNMPKTKDHYIPNCPTLTI